VDAKFLEEKTYSIENYPGFIKDGDIITAGDKELKLGIALLPGWYEAHDSAGATFLYHKGDCGLWKQSPECSILPEILSSSENGIIINKNIEYKKYVFNSPSGKKETDEIVEHMLVIAEMIASFNEKNLSVLYINPDSIYIYKNCIRLSILPELWEIGHKMYSPKDTVAPEVLRHEPATGKEGVYILGLLAIKFLTGKTADPYNDIYFSNYNSGIKIPGFPQFIAKTLIRPEERFTAKEAVGYLKNIIEERKPPLRFDIGMSSTVGLNPYRLIDEDSCGFILENTLDSTGKNLSLRACLADGMGGMAAGEAASRAAVKGFLKTETGLFSELNDLAMDLAWQANKNVFECLEGKDGGCTFIGAVFKNETFSLVHIGDSRAYLWKGSKPKHEIIRLTKDHSYVALMVYNGNMTEEEARQSPDRNKILKSLGSLRNRQEGYIDDLTKTLGKKTEILEKNDTLIIVCDGIWSEIEQEELIEILESNKSDSGCEHGAQDIADMLTALAVEKGASDNASAVIIKRIS